MLDDPSAQMKNMLTSFLRSNHWSTWKEYLERMKLHVTYDDLDSLVIIFAPLNN